MISRKRIAALLVAASVLMGGVNPSLAQNEEPARDEFGVFMPTVQDTEFAERLGNFTPRTEPGDERNKISSANQLGLKPNEFHPNQLGFSWNQGNAAPTYNEWIAAEATFSLRTANNTVPDLPSNITDSVFKIVRPARGCLEFVVRHQRDGYTGAPGTIRTTLEAWWYCTGSSPYIIWSMPEPTYNLDGRSFLVNGERRMRVEVIKDGTWKWRIYYKLSEASNESGNLLFEYEHPDAINNRVRVDGNNNGFVGIKHSVNDPCYYGKSMTLRSSKYLLSGTGGYQWLGVNSGSNQPSSFAVQRAGCYNNNTYSTVDSNVNAAFTGAYVRAWDN